MVKEEGRSLGSKETLGQNCKRQRLTVWEQMDGKESKLTELWGLDK